MNSLRSEIEMVLDKHLKKCFIRQNNTSYKLIRSTGTYEAYLTKLAEELVAVVMNYLGRNPLANR